MALLLLAVGSNENGPYRRSVVGTRDRDPILALFHGSSAVVELVAKLQSPKLELLDDLIHHLVHRLRSDDFTLEAMLLVLENVGGMLPGKSLRQWGNWEGFEAVRHHPPGRRKDVCPGKSRGRDHPYEMG